MNRFIKTFSLVSLLFLFYSSRIPWVFNPRMKRTRNKLVEPKGREYRGLRTLGSLFVFSFLFFLLPSEVSAQVVINEFVSDGNPEWVEIYNSGSTEINLSGWYVLFQDNPDTTQRCYFDQGDAISSSGFKTIERSYSFTNAWLSNAGDTIILKDQNGGEINKVSYGNATGAVVGAPTEGKSASRNPNGSNTWVISDPSKEASWSCISSTPSPSPSPTPSSTQSPSPTPIKSPTPTLTPTKSPTPKLTSTPKPTVTPKSEPSETEEPIVLGIESTPTPPTSSPSPELDGKVAEKVAGWVKNIPLGPLVFIVVGVGLLIGTGIVFLKGNRKKEIEEMFSAGDNQTKDT